jgi:predicted nucleotidyltransferase
MPRRDWSALLRLEGALSADFGRALHKVRLFGSYARNDFDALSDVDVLVVVASLSPAERNRIIDRAVESSTSEVILAPLILTAAELDALRARGMLIAQDIDREGIDVAGRAAARRADAARRGRAA